MEPLVSIVIVNWNSGELLLSCLDSVRASLGAAPRYEIIVVDNGSRGFDASKVSAFASHVISNDANLGFARACNQGARKARGEFLLFLNPDCRVSPGSVEACVAEFHDPTVGAVGVALRNDSGQVSRSCARFPSIRHFLGRLTGLNRLFPDALGYDMRTWPHDVSRDVDHIIGAFYMVPSGLFWRLGGFDERFFVYLEDLDLSLRIHQAGRRIRFLAQPASYHQGGGASQRAKGKRTFYSVRSHALYAFKHFRPAEAWLHFAAILSIEPIARVADRAAHCTWSDLPDVVETYRLLYADLPSLLRRARCP